MLFSYRRSSSSYVSWEAQYVLIFVVSNSPLYSTTHIIWSIYLLLIIFIHQFILLHILRDNISDFGRLKYCSFPVGEPKREQKDGVLSLQFFFGNMNHKNKKKTTNCNCMVLVVNVYTVVWSQKFAQWVFFFDMSKTEKFSFRVLVLCMQAHHHTVTAYWDKEWSNC